MNRTWLLPVFCILLLASYSKSEEVITGKVRDQSGPVAGALVRVQTTEIQTISKQDGTFILTGLKSGQPVKITAWAPGYFITGGEREILPGDHIELLLVPHDDKDHSDYEWISSFSSGNNPNNCQNCHSEPGNPSSALPFDEWLRDAHSKSAQNQRFLTMYSGTDVHGNQSPLTRSGFDRDYGSYPLLPDLTQPYYGSGYKLDFPDTAGNCAACHLPAAAVNTPYSTDPTSVSDVGGEGVNCDFCHKVWDVNLAETGLPYPNRPGVLSFEFRRPHEGHQFFAGPLDDVAPGEDTYSPLQQQSEFCAACHYGVFWDTTIYNSFGEWLDSPYSDPEFGQTCQDCHMPSGLTDHFALPGEGGLIRSPATIPSHRMPGAMDKDFLADAVTLTAEAYKENRGVNVKVEIINDNTGHHIPTDSPLRQLILLVLVTDSEGGNLRRIQGPTIPEWGGVGDPAQGYYAGLPGSGYAKILEEVWTQTSPSGSYWNPTRVVSDNRIPAFETASSSYRFFLKDDGPVTVEIRLIYRRAFIELMDQKDWKTPDILIAEKSFYLD